MSTRENIRLIARAPLQNEDPDETPQGGISSGLSVSIFMH